MRHREIDLIADLLTNLRPASSLEWGAGNGTQYFTQHLPPQARWLSVEHDERWAAAVAEQIDNPNVTVVCRAPNSEPAPGIYTSGTYTAENDGTYEDFRDYIEYPSDHGPFDFVMVDGRARSHCVLKAAELLANDGLVLLHDANRTYYHESLRDFASHAFFLDHRSGAGGIWIGTNSRRPLSDFLDVDFYGRLWNRYARIGRVVNV